MKHLYASATHIGRVSDHNEDHHIDAPEFGLWILADGMGGHNAGEVASKIACDALLESYRSGCLLHEAVADAHPAVLDAIQRDTALQGMGTTLIAVELKDTDYKVAWVGDSRCYHWRQDGLQQVSRDHSYLQMLLDDDSVDNKVALRHPERKSLTHAIGVSNVMRPEVGQQHLQLFKNEMLLLCSDGLTDEVTDQAIAELLMSDNDMQQKCQHLITAALDNGGRDNITVMLIGAAADAPVRPALNPSDAAHNNRRIISVVCAAGASLAVITALVYILIF